MSMSLQTRRKISSSELFQKFVPEPTRGWFYDEEQNRLLEEKGWAREETLIASLGNRAYTIIYCHHPTVGYKRSPSIADLLD